MRALRILAAGIAAAATWWAGLIVVFGPAQQVLADPERQSGKFLAAFTQEPLPRMFGEAWALPLGLLLVGTIHACVYSWLGSRLGASTLRRGAAFGVLAWALMVPWFEFYLPWNVMREPLPLVLLEALCWLVVQVVVGIVIAVVDGVGRRATAGPA